MKGIIMHCIVLFCCFIGCATVFGAKEESEKRKLLQEWQIQGGLQVPESVLYNPFDDTLYVSNICGKPKEKNGQGFISTLSPEGDMKTLKWATGLNAPKGMAIVGKSLFVADIDQVVEIDLPEGKVVNRYPVPGARFLNDVASDGEGTVYISDSSKKNSKIYALRDGQIEVWLEGGEIKKPNGLLVEKDRLLVGNSGDKCVKAIKFRDKQVEIVARVGSAIDGLQPDSQGNYVVSDWKGKTSFVSAKGEVVVLMDTTASKINSADLCYVPGRNIIIIPTFFDNRVVAYRMQ